MHTGTYGAGCFLWVVGWYPHLSITIAIENLIRIDWDPVSIVRNFDTRLQRLPAVSCIENRIAIFPAKPDPVLLF